MHISPLSTVLNFMRITLLSFLNATTAYLSVNNMLLSFPIFEIEKNYQMLSTMNCIFLFTLLRLIYAVFCINSCNLFFPFFRNITLWLLQNLFIHTFVNVLHLIFLLLCTVLIWTSSLVYIGNDFSQIVCANFLLWFTVKDKF